MKYLTYLNDRIKHLGIFIESSSVDNIASSYRCYFPEKVVCDMYIIFIHRLMHNKNMHISGSIEYIMFMNEVAKLYKNQSYDVFNDVDRFIHYINSLDSDILLKLERAASDSVFANKNLEAKDLFTIQEEDENFFKDIPFEVEESIRFSNDEDLSVINNTKVDVCYSTMNTYSEVQYIPKGSLGLPWTRSNILRRKASTIMLSQKNIGFNELVIIIPSYYKREQRSLIKYIGLVLAKRLEESPNCIIKIVWVNEDGGVTEVVRDKISLSLSLSDNTDNNYKYVSNQRIVDFIENNFTGSTVHYFPIIKGHNTVIEKTDACRWVFYVPKLHANICPDMNGRDTVIYLNT